MPLTSDAQTREQIGHLYDYLSALAQEVYAKPVRHVGNHEVSAAPADIPAHPSVRIGAAAGEAWLRVAKTPRPVPPAFPPVLAAIFHDVTRSDPHSPPALPTDLGERVGASAEESATVAAAFSRWVEQIWQPWADQAKAAVAARTLYDTLFKLRQRIRTDEATHELVWGHGILGWEFGGHRICHPMLASRVRITFDELSGELSVVADDLPALELDCLQGMGVPNLAQLHQIGEDLRSDPADVWNTTAAHTLYRRILAPLGLDDRIEDGSDLPTVGPAPAMAATWRLYVRKRRVMFLRFFEQLKNSLDERETLPAPMVALAAGEEAAQRVSSGDAAVWAPVAEQLLMPLPANEEQERIARKLAEHSGVTVQGPPGTGKSHTIANLVSHLVAHGKRVLVTAHKDQALAVLRDKIPAELRDLSMAVLGSTSADLTELQRSVQAITSAADNVDEKKETTAVAALRGRLDQVQAEILLLRKRLLEALEHEQDVLELGGRRRRAAEVAEWLAQREGELDRIPDLLGLQDLSPVSAAELGELFALAGRIDPGDAVACTAWLPSPQELPTADELAQMHDDLRHLAEVLAAYQDYLGDPTRLDALGETALSLLGEDTAKAATVLEGLQTDWLRQLREQATQDPKWRTLWSGHTDRLREDAHRCADLRTRISGARIELPEGGHRELIGSLDQLRQRYAEGKKVSPLLNRALAQFLKSTRIDDEHPLTVEDVDRIIAFVDLRRLRDSMANLWSSELVAVFSAPVCPTASAAVESWIDGRTQEIQHALVWESETWPQLRARLVDAVDLEAIPGRPDSADLHKLADVLNGLKSRARQRTLEARLGSLESTLEQSRVRAAASPLWGDLVDALRSGDWDRWQTTLATAIRLAALHPQVVRLNELGDRLAAVTPRWAARIRDTRGDVAGCGEPGDLNELWQWRQAETWLRAITHAEDLGELQRRLDQAQDERRRVTLELTRRSAWLAMKKNLGHTQRQALVGWLQTLRKIGRGTGAGANKWRAEAQRQMPLAMGAVPVWIMPYYRVAESFDPMVAPPFDVVIIDESSQCDVFALGLLGLGHKVVVVGDDRQISPSAVGANQGRVDELIRTHLPSFPNALLLDLQSSLYDASGRLFPGVVQLREHFRCLPRIIEFSSQTYYGGEIQALREESDDRLPGPVVQAVHVPDGVRQDLNIGNINEAEARALVDGILACCADPAYDGRSMGVISLLSSSRQAQYIDQILLEKLGPEEYERRDLRCGDSYSFQGDERDVIFISVVADDNRGAFTSKPYEQRVNVAASRARDQMWVFHSVRPDQLHPDDQRAKLIRYAADGQRSADVAKDLEARCDSDFERRVLRMLLARDYLVTPQHPVGRLRIDLVVRGGGQKLAIECDGDAFHGPDQWEEDLRRQSVLERLGWRFWRVRGSVFYRNPEAAMASLWKQLDELGIRPGPEPEAHPEPMPVPVPATMPVILREEQ